jgi:broad specificity phosphatase PhoE
MLRVLCAFAFVATLAQDAFAQSTLVFIVRHAEKAAAPANDPPLTPEGAARATALVDVLANAGISAIISTPYARTVGTAKPLAEKLGVKVDSVAIAGGTPAHVQAVADAVRKHAGKAVLVVGHSNTITAIATALGGPKMADLCDGDYDQLFVLELPASGAPRFTRARYGAVAVDSKCQAMSK